MTKKPQPAKISSEPVSSDEAVPLFAIANDLIEKYHHHLRQANIQFAWAYSWTPDDDDIRQLGKAKKVADPDRAMHGFDWIIMLNREAWEQDLSEAQRVALIDHELCHCGVVYTDDNNPKLDEHDRIVYRVRKHEYQDFADIARRHGKNAPGLVEFGESAQLELFGKEA